MEYSKNVVVSRREKEVYTVGSFSRFKNFKRVRSILHFTASEGIYVFLSASKFSLQYQHLISQRSHENKGYDHPT